MGKSEKTGKGTGSLASKAMRDPGSLTNKQVKSLAASTLTQRPNRKSSPSRKK